MPYHYSVREQGPGSSHLTQTALPRCIFDHRSLGSNWPWRGEWLGSQLEDKALWTLASSGGKARAPTLSSSLPTPAAAPTSSLSTRALVLAALERTKPTEKHLAPHPQPPHSRDHRVTSPHLYTSPTGPMITGGLALTAPGEESPELYQQLPEAQSCINQEKKINT